RGGGRRGDLDRFPAPPRRLRRGRTAPGREPAGRGGLGPGAGRPPRGRALPRARLRPRRRSSGRQRLVDPGDLAPVPGRDVGGAAGRGSPLPAPAGPARGGRAMNVARSLTFQGTPWTLTASIVVVLATAGLGLLAWRRSGRRPALGALEMLRLGLVGAVALLLNQPEWIEEFRPEEKPSIAVLCDASPSMDTRDVVRADRPAAPPTTRREAIAALTEPSTWGRLRERLNVVVQPFAPARTGHGSDLYEPLARAP